MNWPALSHDDAPLSPPALGPLRDYLTSSGWSLVDEDSRTSMWRPGSSPSLGKEFFVVLPEREDIQDYGELIYDALRAVAYAERRSIDEIVSDINYGAADTVSARLVPDSPPGEAPLSLAYAALSALRSYVIGSGSALDDRSLVLPTRRPPRAESYANKVRFAAKPGSFILTLALPLLDTLDDVPPITGDTTEPSAEHESPELAQAAMFDIAKQPFGRQITNRMAAAARCAQSLADSVNSGDLPLRVFGMPGGEVANATELEALSGLGGPERSPYRLRFAQTPLAARSGDATVLQVTPGQQRIMAEAAVYLRTQQPRDDVTVEGTVVRLSRDHHYGPGVVVVEGIADDSGAVRRFYLELAEKDYNEAFAAHGQGLRVIARGDLDTRGSYKWLRPLHSFAVMPGLEYEQAPPR